MLWRCVVVASIALLQREPGLQILGSWFVHVTGEIEHREFLALAVAAAREDEDLVVELRADTLPAQVLEDAGFALLGRTRPMVCGNLVGINLERLMSFASLGSMG